MVASVTNSEGKGAITKAENRASVSRDQFLKILVAELSSQSPLDPLDNGQFMQQLASLQNLEQTAALTDSLKTFERFLQMTSGSALIGKQIKGLTPEGDTVQGTVSRVVLEGNKVNLVVGTQKVPVNSISEIVSGS